MGKLTALDVQRLTERGMYSDGDGLCLQVRQGAKSWIFRYTLNGKARHLGLGSAKAISLKRARELAAEPRRQCAEGIDPVETKRSARAAAMVAAAGLVTFKEFAASYLESHQHTWGSARHRHQWSVSLERAYPLLGAVPVRDINTPMILQVLQPIWRRTPETASRVRGRIERVLNAAKAAGLRSGENPATWRGHLENLLPKPGKLKKPQHFEALPHRQVGAFVQAVRSRKSISARVLEFTILTAARTGEVLGAQWDEIDLDQHTWTIPASRMKSGKEHRIPLSDAALAVLRPIHAVRSGELVFSGNSGRRMSPSTMLMLVELMGHEGVTVHGFRSTFRDWAAEQTAFPNEVVEMALAHQVGSAVERAYRRGDLFEKRSRLMTAWADYCGQHATSGEVVPIRA